MPNLFRQPYNNTAFAYEWSPAELGMSAVNQKAAPATEVASDFLDITGCQKFSLAMVNTQTGTPAAGVNTIRIDVYAADRSTVVLADLVLATVTLATVTTVSKYWINWSFDAALAAYISGGVTGAGVVVGAASTGGIGVAPLSMRNMSLVKLKHVISTASTATLSSSVVYFRASP